MATSSQVPPVAAPAGGAARAHSILALTFVAGAVIQFFLAGLGAFKFDNADSSAFDPHRIMGDLLTLFALIILILAVVGRREARQASVVLFVLMIIQQVLAGAGESTPILGALHGLNGLFILGAAGFASAGRPVEFGAHGHGHGGGRSAGT